MEFSWNLVTKGFDPEPKLERQLRKQISQLEKPLEGFSLDSVHLTIRLEQTASNPGYRATVTLRIPSNIWHTARKAGNPVSALKKAVGMLRKELQSLREERRHPDEHKGLARPKVPASNQCSPPTERSSSERSGLQNRMDCVGAWIQRHYQRLVDPFRRRIYRAEAGTGFPPGTLVAIPRWNG